jgi:hypothetical protein
MHARASSRVHCLSVACHHTPCQPLQPVPQVNSRRKTLQVRSASPSITCACALRVFPTSASLTQSYSTRTRRQPNKESGAHHVAHRWSRSMAAKSRVPDWKCRSGWSGCEGALNAMRPRSCSVLGWSGRGDRHDTSENLLRHSHFHAPYLVGSSIPHYRCPGMPTTHQLSGQHSAMTVWGLPCRVCSFDACRQPE